MKEQWIERERKKDLIITMTTMQMKSVISAGVSSCRFILHDSWENNGTARLFIMKIMSKVFSISVSSLHVHVLGNREDM